MEASRLDGRRTWLETLNLLQRYTVVVDRVERRDQVNDSARRSGGNR